MKNLPGIMIIAAGAATAIFFGIRTGSWTAAIAEIAAVLLIGAVFLRKSERRGLFAAGTVLCVFLGAVLVTAGIFIPSVTTEALAYSRIGIYVSSDDPAESLEELEDDVFGIVSEIDAGNTIAAVTDIEEALGQTIKTSGFDSLPEAVTGLTSGRCRALITNAALLDILNESAEYAGVSDTLKEITTLHITEEPVEKKTEYEFEPFLLYISGIDSRDGMQEKSRSDVNILAAVNPYTHNVLLVNTPRDYYVPLSISNGVPDKLTHAGIYGIDVSMDTMSMLYDADIDYYVRFSFDGFKDVIDTIGGITVYVDEAFRSYSADYTFHEGYNELDGETALLFVRERMAFADGDFKRGENEMQVITAVADKVLHSGMLSGVKALLTVMSGDWETDIPTELLLELAADQLENDWDWQIFTYSVTGETGKAIPYSLSTYASVVIPDEESVDEAKMMLNAILTETGA